MLLLNQSMMTRALTKRPRFFKAAMMMAVIFFIPGLKGAIFAQQISTMGYSGVMLVPSADVAKDGQMSIGFSRIPELYASRLRPYDRSLYFARLGFLPFLEGTAMIVRPDNYAGGAGDRSFHVKIRLLNEKGKRPAIALGAQDFFAIKGLKLEPARAQHFAALYAAASKNVQWHSVAVRLHFGYGTDWLPAKSYFLDGFFGGLTLSPHRYFSLLAEYDAHELNAGLRLHPCSHLQAQLAYWKLRQLTATLALSFSLQ